jgi:CubicO group peptidase (beta-lactamase class C family)
MFTPHRSLVPPAQLLVISRRGSRRLVAALALALITVVSGQPAAVQKPVPASVPAQPPKPAQPPGEKPARATAAAQAARPLAQTAAPLADLDAAVTKMMANWKVPGVAIAIVKDGKVILSKGYGLRDVKNNLPVTTNTMFPIASITKSFTVATLASLASEGKLSWDKPVRDYLPEFRMNDDVLTARITTRDLVTHRTGLPRHDATWYNVEMPRADIVGLLRYLDASKDLRETFQYNNLMFLTAGYLGGRLAGGTWEDAVRARVFKPLGMTSSNFSVDESKKSPDWAHAYQKDDREDVHEVPVLKADDVGPAGSINSNLDDMTQYLLMYLNGGRHGDTQVISQSDIRQMTSPHMIIPTTGIDPELGFNHYGMGLFVTTYRGHTIVHHGGNLDGFSLLLSFLPDDKAGVVILTNMDGTSLREVLTYHIYDRLLGLDRVDWNGRLMARYLAEKKAEDEATAKNYIPRREGTRPAHAMDEYVGDYAHPAYGAISIARGTKETDLNVSYHGSTSTAAHWHYEQWKIPQNALDRLARTDLAFNTDRQGNIASVSVPLEPTVKDIVFARQADRRMRERSFLEPLVGTYQLGELEQVIGVRGDNVLTYTTPTGATYPLEPVRGMTFAITGVNGGTIDFKKDASGAVTEFAITTPGTTSVAKRIK